MISDRRNPVNRPRTTRREPSPYHRPRPRMTRAQRRAKEQAYQRALTRALGYDARIEEDRVMRALCGHFLGGAGR
jgi:hypothetical protein